MEPRVEVALHQRPDKNGIKSAAEIEADRNVGTQSMAYRFVELLENGPCALLRSIAKRLRNRLHGFRWDLRRPIPNDIRFVRIEVDRNVTRGRDMLDSFERKQHSVGILVEDRVECRDIQLRLNQAAGEDRLHLGREHEPVPQPRKIAGLDSDPVAGGDEQPLCAVVEKAREFVAAVKR